MAVFANVSLAPSVAASGLDLWSLPVVWQEDWSGGGFRLSTGWGTRVTRGADGTHTRVGSRNRPHRKLGLRVVGLRPDDVRWYREECYRRVHAYQLLPLAPDVTWWEGKASHSAALNWLCDTTYRRFYVGGYVALAELRHHLARLPRFHVAKLTAVTDTQISIDAPVGVSLAGPVRIVPLLECLPLSSASAQLADPVAGTITVEAVERPGRSALPAWLAAGGEPPGWPSFNDGSVPLNAPILYPPPDYRDVAVGVEADEEQAASGLALYMLRRGPVYNTARLSWTARRPDAVQLLRFFDGRRGRTFPYWLPSPAYDLEVLAVGADSVTVRAGGYSVDWARWGYLSVRHAGGIYFGKISGVVRAVDGLTDTVTLASTPLGFTLASIDTAGLAMPAAFAADEITEEWLHDDLCLISLPASEVLESAEGPGITPPPPGDPPLPPNPPPDGPEPPEPPGPPMCVPLLDCNGNATDYGIPVDPGVGGALVYNPGDGAGYTPSGPPVLCDTVIVLEGWQPGDGDEPWWPICPEEPEDPADPTGAICYPDGTCGIGTAAEAAASGGVYQGDGTDCGGVVCPVELTGAICWPDDTCSVGTEADAAAGNGTWLGVAECGPDINCACGCGVGADDTLSVDVTVDVDQFPNDETCDVIGTYAHAHYEGTLTKVTTCKFGGNLTRTWQTSGGAGVSTVYAEVEIATLPDGTPRWDFTFTAGFFFAVALTSTYLRAQGNLEETCGLCTLDRDVCVPRPESGDSSYHTVSGTITLNRGT
jgi:hypothetical protein